ncbi:MAG: VOC family protein [Rhodospirillaceae bacterium]|nr:VOC family protein [Rhodospirillaceae bacterium]MBT6084411.1 VOC family protein [Rhodospirillaceae bacterium]MBT6608920.1 VOC family protein [Rhodospirillaceae bacterium]MBT6884283.1 VOC family protein [Rhodospirillaceae bacterium]
MASTNQLDHTVINVKFDMDTAAPLFEALGFTLTPRGFHSTGSMNHLMMFGTDYLELIGLPEGADHQRPDVAEAPLGINGIVFKSANVDDTYAHMQTVGVDGDPPKAFSRPVDMPGGAQDAKFRTVTSRGDAFPGGRVYFCEHATPELVWQPQFQSHANEVTHMPEFVIVSEDAPAEAERFAKLLDTYIQDNGDSLTVPIDGCDLTVMAPAAYQDRYGEFASPMNGRQGIFGAIVFGSNELGSLNERLEDAPAGVEAETDIIRTVVRIPGFDAVLEFIVG